MERAGGGRFRAEWVALLTSSGTNDPMREAPSTEWVALLTNSGTNGDAGVLLRRTGRQIGRSRSNGRRRICPKSNRAIPSRAVAWRNALLRDSAARRPYDIPKYQGKETDMSVGEAIQSARRNRGLTQ
jgi:hypothetical protein